MSKRWCCDVLKKYPSKLIPLKHRIMGIRAEESPNRKHRGRMDKFGKVFKYHPIFEWMEWQVWEFIEKYNIPYPSLYDEGYERIGCILCPFLTPRMMKRNMERWPQTYRTFETVVKGWWYPQSVKHFQIYEQFLNFWYGFKRF
jgi:phosphoadenosine phosphosulfate reductase